MSKNCLERISMNNTVKRLIAEWEENKKEIIMNKIQPSVAKDKVVILDFETTGANVTNHPDTDWGYFKGQTWYDAIQIALIDTSVTDSSTKSGYAEYSWRIRPHKDYANRTDWATSVHGHTRDDYMKRTDLHEWSDIFPQISRIINGKTVIAHNAFGFDKSVLEQMCDKYNLLLPVFDWRDTKAELKEMYPDRKHSQKDVAEWMQLDEDFQGHDALVDVQMLTKIYFKMEELKKENDDFYFV